MSIWSGVYILLHSCRISAFCPRWVPDDFINANCPGISSLDDYAYAAHRKLRTRHWYIQASSSGRYKPPMNFTRRGTSHYREWAGCQVHQPYWSPFGPETGHLTLHNLSPAFSTVFSVTVERECCPVAAPLFSLHILTVLSYSLFVVFVVLYVLFCLVLLFCGFFVFLLWFVYHFVRNPKKKPLPCGTAAYIRTRAYTQRYDRRSTWLFNGGCGFRSRNFGWQLCYCLSKAVTMPRD